CARDYYGSSYFDFW
nr:immunoglobulin heavy chain junction region [Mus musculus]